MEPSFHDLLQLAFSRYSPLRLLLTDLCSGKSTIGHDLSLSLSLPFLDGDSLHPQSNVDKMSRGIPLTDDDRLPWLALIRSTGMFCMEFPLDIAARLVSRK